MRFTEIVSRLTGFSTPIFGVSWNPPQADVAVARKVLTFLEDRRVLYDPLGVENPEYCVASVLEIRKFLTAVLIEGNDSSALADHLRAMRAACRRFLGYFGYREDLESDPPASLGPSYQGLMDYRLNQSLGELRALFGVHIAQIAVKYGLDVEGELAGVLPAPADENAYNKHLQRQEIAGEVWPFLIGVNRDTSDKAWTLLKAFYELAEGDNERVILGEDAAQKAGLSSEDFEAVLPHLFDPGVRPDRPGYIETSHTAKDSRFFRITDEGIRQIEE